VIQRIASNSSRGGARPVFHIALLSVLAH
jgi:hypothetical protein